MRRRDKQELKLILIISIAITIGFLIWGLKNSIDDYNEQFKTTQFQSETKSTQVITDVTLLAYETETPIEIESTEEEEEKDTESLVYSKDWGADDSELLARIAYCKAGNQSIECMEKVIWVVLNRVWSNQFPGTIEEVIMQDGQFSPIENGSWEKSKNANLTRAYQAVENVMYGDDDSQGALYFESCDGCSWHSKHLKFLYRIGDMRFYK